MTSVADETVAVSVRMANETGTGSSSITWQFLPAQAGPRLFDGRGTEEDGMGTAAGETKTARGLRQSTGCF